MTDILCVFGTRPEVVKIAPVVTALRALGVRVHALHTGQHADLANTTALAGMGAVVETLGIASEGTLLRFTARALPALRKRLAELKPRVVLVQGDTWSALVGAQAALETNIPIAHVEAGVRSHAHDPWPEETIRCAIDRWATWKYAATEHALRNLEREGLAADALVTGNTCVDALRTIGAASGTEAAPTLLVTLHRREFRARPDALALLQVLVDALGAAPHCRALWPVHPAMLDLARQVRVPPNVALCPPLAYSDMLNVLAGARGVLTDSGGLVEEAATLGVPTAILRDVNDRPEAVEDGIARQFPLEPAAFARAVAALALCTIPRRPSAAYGDGHAAERIAVHLASQRVEAREKLR